MALLEITGFTQHNRPSENLSDGLSAYYNPPPQQQSEKPNGSAPHP
ncbi:hypothetical protein HMPREF9120_02546 [Neisseria sp. oral taxon 020 str. F0370]|nr:hypothetical protein HMPREF9120_02546 [Neisseria sp. oral taxon 020 str. F0370]